MVMMSAAAQNDLETEPFHDHSTLYNGKRVLLLFDMDNTLTPASDLIQDS